MVDNNSRCIVHANEIRVCIDRNVIVIISWSVDNWVLGNREKKIKTQFFLYEREINTCSHVKQS